MLGMYVCFGTAISISVGRLIYETPCLRRAVRIFFFGWS